MCTSKLRFAPRQRVAERFLIVRPLGHSPIGDVYLAKDTRLGRDVTLRALRTDDQEKGSRQRAIEALRRDAALAAQLQHPFIQSLHDVMLNIDPPLLVMEFVRGASLKKRLLQSNMPFRSQIPPLKGALETLRRIQDQDLEPDPDRGGIKIREGVAKDRQISISDLEMRHGRKSKTKRFDGYKRHVLHDIDEKLILAVDVGPANEADHVRLEGMVAAAENQDRELKSLHIDLGYFSAAVALHKVRADVDVVCKSPGIGGHRGYFTKRDFIIDTQAQRVTCPNGVAVDFDVWGQRVTFPEHECMRCPLRKACTSRQRGGRTLGIHVDEVMHQELLKSQRSSAGRKALRERVKVEHALGRVSHNQGSKARYRGLEKNVFHMQIQGGLYNLQRAAAFWERVSRKAA